MVEEKQKPDYSHKVIISYGKTNKDEYVYKSCCINCCEECRGNCYDCCDKCLHHCETDRNGSATLCYICCIFFIQFVCLFCCCGLCCDE